MENNIAFTNEDGLELCFLCNEKTKGKNDLGISHKERCTFHLRLFNQTTILNEKIMNLMKLKIITRLRYKNL